MKISRKITLSTVISLSVLGIIITWLNYNSTVDLKKEFLREYKIAVNYEIEDKLRTITQIAVEIADSTYNNQMKQGATDEYMRGVLRKRFQELKFFDDKSGYVFVYEMDGTVFSMPNTELTGKNLIHMKDSSGKYFLRDLLDKAKEGGGIVHYEFPKPGLSNPEPKLAYSTLFKPLNLMMGVGVYTDTIDNDVKEMSKELQSYIEKELFFAMCVSFCVLIISLCVIVYILHKNLSVPLREIVKHSNELSSGNGDLTRHLPIKGNDELSELSKSINIFIEKIHHLVQDSKSLSTENASISSELSSTSLQVGKSVEKTMGIIEKTTSESENIKREISIKSSEVRRGSEKIDEVSNKIKNTANTILELTAKIKKSAADESELAHEIEELSKEAIKIRDVLNIIDDIAEQTNLLSLNAAIEAARAGEHGRGFAVVADEVRKLAEKTQDSLRDINISIESVISKINQTSKNAVVNSNNMLKVSEESEQSEENLKVTLVDFDEISKINLKTSEEFQNVSKDVDKIINSINDISTLSSENARNTEEIASASEHLYRMTESLNNKLNEFKTKG